MDPSWGQLRPTWPFQANLEANLASKLLSARLQAHSKTSEQPSCSLSEGNLPREICKNHWFSLGFLKFCTSQPFATLHPQLKPSKPKTCLQMPSWTPQEWPRRAKMAQDEPKMGPERRADQRQKPARSFWEVSWAHLGANLGQPGLNSGSTWPFQANREANLVSKLLFARLQTHSKTSKQQLCSLSESNLPREICKNHWFSLGF